MLKVTIQDLHRDSSRCADDCGRYRVEGCGACTLRFRVAFECPNCKVVRCFYGANSPMSCSSCKTRLPDLYALSQAKHYYVRVKYHQESTE